MMLNHSEEMRECYQQIHHRIAPIASTQSTIKIVLPSMVLSWPKVRASN